MNTQILINFNKVRKEENYEQMRKIAKEHEDLFWFSFDDVNKLFPIPDDGFLQHCASNPIPDGKLECGLNYMSIWYNVIVQLPTGTWVAAGTDGTWHEVDGYLIAWENSQELVAHLVKL